MPQESITDIKLQVPSEEQVVLNVPLLLEKEEGASDKHQGSRGRRRFKRDSVLPDRPFRPLRITLYYDPVSIDPLPVSKQSYINVGSQELL